MSSHIVRPFAPQNAKLQSRPKSSAKARKLIEAAVSKYGSERAAAKHFKMSHSQLNRIRKGEIADTPRMKAIIAQRERVSQRAFLGLPPKKIPESIDLEAIKAHAVMTINTAETLLELLKG